MRERPAESEEKKPFLDLCGIAREGYSVQQATPSRRLTSRVNAPVEVWVYWSCDGREDVSRVRNLSVGGLFLETSDPRPVGIKANLDFLVQEGHIRADVVVRHAAATGGLGLKFLAVKETDLSNLAALVTRLRSLLGPRSYDNADRRLPTRFSVR